MGLFSVLSNRLKPHHKCIILSFQYQKLHRKSNESAQDWMGRLWTKVIECEYSTWQTFTEQFTGVLNDSDITDEILREVRTLGNIVKDHSEHLISWVCRVEAQRAQRSTFNNIKESKDFNVIWQNTQKWVCWNPCSERCKYCSTGHSPQWCPAYRGTVKNVAKTITSRQYAGPHRGNRQTGCPRCWKRHTSKVRLAQECQQTKTGVLMQ